MTPTTIAPGVLTVGAALPDPPFELIEDGSPTGFDVGLMQAVAADLGLAWRLRRYEGADFNAIFAGLGRDWDCVASGATITPERERVARFCAPYLVSGQALVADPDRNPGLASLDDLAGRTLGVQQGNTSQPVAERLKAEGRVGAVRVYPYHAIETMLDDVEAGRIDAAMKLGPVLAWLVRDRPALKVVAEGLTEERIAVAVAPGNAALGAAIDGAQARLQASGALAALAGRWAGA